MNTKPTKPEKIDLRTLKPTGTEELEKTILEAIRRDEIRCVRKKAAFYGLCAGSVLGAVLGSAAMFLGLLLWSDAHEMKIVTHPQEQVPHAVVTEIQDTAKSTVDFPDLRFPELESVSQRVRIVESAPKPTVSHESFVNRQRQNTLLIREILENKTFSESIF